jgi:hypothetical protein
LSTNSRKIIICLTVVFLLLTLYKSFYFSGKYGGTDLRCRIVGARLLTTPHSPYFYKWKPADSEFYLDPNDEAHKIVNGNVVTPATLAVIYPLSQLPYPQVRLLWTILQIIAALAIVFLLFKSDGIPRTVLIAAPAILGFICSEAWLYNIERGQMYIFYALLFGIMYRLYISKLKYNQFLSGFTGGLFILFRPFAAIISLPFLLHARKQWIVGCIAGSLAGILLFVLPQPQNWLDYFKAMPEYINLDRNTGQLRQEAEPVKPAVIEGTTNITEYRMFNIGRLETTYHFFKRFGIPVSVNQSLLLFGIAVAFLSWFFFRLKKKNPEPDILFLFGFLLFLLSELFIPAPRGGYNVILWIFPMSLIYLRSRSDIPLLVILATALLLFHEFPFSFPHQGELAELLFVLITLYIIFFRASFKKLPDGNSRT